MKKRYDLDALGNHPQNYRAKLGGKTRKKHVGNPRQVFGKYIGNSVELIFRPQLSSGEIASETIIDDVWMSTEACTPY